MRITTAAQAAHRDAEAIASGIESFALMHAAGQAAAQFVAGIVAGIEAPLVWIVAGTGNNGGDAYVVAAELLANEFNVVLAEIGEPRSEDAKRARELYREARANAAPALDMDTFDDSVRFVVVDGMLGTGQQGPLREQEKLYAQHINRFRADGSVVVALDLPTGVNATTGETVDDAVLADYTLSFGTLKRAHVLEREQCGEIVVLDIGLDEFADIDDDAWELADRESLVEQVPRIEWQAHKGTRGRVAIVGGTRGMAGAVVLASEAALRSGAGLLHAHVHADSVLPLQISLPQAITHEWSRENLLRQLGAMDAIVIGPGLGRQGDSERLLADLLEILADDLPRVPIVLDADALTLIGSDVARLKTLASSRELVCTPHVGEFARLIGKPVAESLADRISQVQELVVATGVTVLLKGTPTVVVSPGNQLPVVIARGTPVLATGGSGDMLSGMIGALLGQGANGAEAAEVAAWAHGRAAEIATDAAGVVRGLLLRDVMKMLPAAWKELSARSGGSVFASEHVLLHLPRVWSDNR